MTPTAVGVGEGDWLAGENNGKLQARANITARTKTIIRGVFILSPL
jgi:hypothetical protein